VAVDNSTRWIRDEAQNRQRADRLSTSGLANYGDSFALINIVGNPVYCSDYARGRKEMRIQILYFE